MSVYVQIYARECNTHRGQEMAYDPLKLELQVIALPAVG